MNNSTAFDAFWSQWVYEACQELQFDSRYGFPVRLAIGEDK